MAEAMTWIRTSPFRHGQDPLDHRLLALSVEAEAAGTPLSDTERKMLAAEAAPERPIPDDLKERVKPLISTIFQRERTADPGTIQLVLATPWSGWSPIKDRAQLVGCAIALVVALMAIAVAIGFLFGRR